MKATTIALALVAAALFANAESRVARGDPAEGRQAFAKLRCDTCHSVYGEMRVKPAPHPLPDLSRQTPEAVANMIVSRTHLAPEALFDEQVMSTSASGMTQRELADIVAYLRVKR